MTQLTGYVVYRNYAAMQHEAAIPVLKEFVKIIQPQRILEIGTAHGGLTMVLRDALDEAGLNASTLRTFDVQAQPWYDALRSHRIEVCVENLFSDNYQALVKPDLVVPFVQAEGCTLVLCDGGYKVGEFNLLADYLKPGDYIMAHDYIATADEFLQHFHGKVWDWHEVSAADLQEACTRNSLEDVDKEAFAAVVWTCKVKKGPVIR